MLIIIETHIDPQKHSKQPNRLAHNLADILIDAMRSHFVSVPHQFVR